MCIFSRAVERVSGTRIFCRNTGDGYQSLVYRMSYTADEDLAMILPLPVPNGAPENAVRFVNLEDYPNFFTDLEKAFIDPNSFINDLDRLRRSRGTLQVHRVGAFIASFVPTIQDFERLDAQFRLPNGALDRIPVYHDFGFAVFQLRGMAERRRRADAAQQKVTASIQQISTALRDAGIEDEQTSDWLEYSKSIIPEVIARAKSPILDVHPMAFTFPQRKPGVLFFPTVHVHDGQVHEQADFDHWLYCQPDALVQGHLGSWTASYAAASAVCASRAFANDLVDPAKRFYRKRLEGRLKNQDTLVGRWN
jgi:hypothetical protein